MREAWQAGRLHWSRPWALTALLGWRTAAGCLSSVRREACRSRGARFTRRTRPRRCSAVILTHNEEDNLGPCLASLAGWVAEVFVVDSGSTDATCAIAERHGARVLEHPFETHARQWLWALATSRSSTSGCLRSTPTSG